MKTATPILSSKLSGGRESGPLQVRFLRPSETYPSAQPHQTSPNRATKPQFVPAGNGETSFSGALNEESLPTGSVVYFVRAPNGLIKIGTTITLRNRLLSLRSGSPVELDLVALLIDQGRAVEQELHAIFTGSRAHGEWFRPTEEILAFVARVVAGISGLALSQLIYERLGDQSAQKIVREYNGLHRRIGEVARSLPTAAEIGR